MISPTNTNSYLESGSNSSSVNFNTPKFHTACSVAGYCYIIVLILSVLLFVMKIVKKHSIFRHLSDCIIPFLFLGSIMKMSAFFVFGTSEDGFENFYGIRNSTGSSVIVLNELGNLFLFIAYAFQYFVLMKKWCYYLGDCLDICTMDLTIGSVLVSVLHILMEICCCFLEPFLKSKRDADLVHDSWYLIVFPLWTISSLFFGIRVLVELCKNDIIGEEGYLRAALGTIVCSLFFIFHIVSSILNITQIRFDDSGFVDFVALQLFCEIVPTIVLSFLYIIPKLLSDCQKKR